MTLRGLSWLGKMIVYGEYKNFLIAIWFRIYQQLSELVFWFNLSIRSRKPQLFKGIIGIKTKHLVAFKSPDHLIPWGTKYDNSTHKKFILHMEGLIGESTPQSRKSFLDLGCSGGQLVADFRNLGWTAVGLEGSDYSLKHQRANWPELANRNLFTCDITKPFQVLVNGKKHYFQLITAWEVLEHIKTNDLPALFKNIIGHLDCGGYFIASTTSISDSHDGIDFHQTKMTNQQWRTWFRRNIPELEPVDLGLKFYQLVRYNFERSFLAYQKKKP